MFIDFIEGGITGEREGERERDRNTDVREKIWLVASCRCPDQGSNLQPRDVP